MPWFDLPPEQLAEYRTSTSEPDGLDQWWGERLAEARIAADRENKPVGEVKTACQAACPAQAFTFGNLADTDSEVSKRKQSPLNFAMLEAQGTRPRTTYEALVRNPNPSIKGQGR